MSLLLANKQIYHEASEKFYRVNVFSFNRPKHVKYFAEEVWGRGGMSFLGQVTHVIFKIHLVSVDEYHYYEDWNAWLDLFGDKDYGLYWWLPGPKHITLDFCEVGNRNFADTRADSLEEFGVFREELKWSVCVDQVCVWGVEQETAKEMERELMEFDKESLPEMPWEPCIPLG